ncbi:YafY family transcriptional regulator [Paenibacillus polysaccharolyticus]|uniref:YafY family transcriptional regulator n=1 Tax=Paenibacillus cucumis (ex Kampfer et al. 2016) TaxID=1776858 RepID=A0ABS7KNY6_9BACL|nr:MULTISPECIES: YafY family protein [Paenibacillus]MBY0205883.1 YafY family transcriptional regulator [Paenibacillus cucumis (ex Kampfer et al. 2016)]MCP1132422.1 YafY family transcriptional regulator [Paenibacillus polysaccharolyticus]
MHKAQRLVQLIMLVNERRTFTVQELADECGVSRRTMIRDLAELSELGIPLYSEVGPHGGYRVLREKVLPPISFSEHEAMALFFAAQSLQNYKSLPFNNEVQSALRKFFHYLSSDLKHKIERMQQRLTFWVPPHELDVPYLKELLEAALEQRIVQIRYEASSVQERLIQPLGLYTMNGLWYCRAYCFRAMDHRVFRVDRVIGLQCEVDQSQKVDLNEENIQEWIIREDLETPLELKVSLSPEGVRRCQSDVWLSQFLKVNEDGSGTIHAHIGTSYTPWVVGFFLGLGTDAHVTHPPQVRDQIRTKLQAMAAQYGD